MELKQLSRLLVKSRLKEPSQLSLRSPRRSQRKNKKKKRNKKRRKRLDWPLFQKS
jgi:hypothetical protein